MILRAIFWISVVAILMPHEPNLGFGRPATTSSVLSQVTSVLKSPQGCDGQQAACPDAASPIDSIKAQGYRRLAQVKADIEEAQRERRAGANLTH